MVTGARSMVDRMFFLVCAGGPVVWLRVRTTTGVASLGGVWLVLGGFTFLVMGTPVLEQQPGIQMESPKLQCKECTVSRRRVFSRTGAWISRFKRL
eukprot:494734-Amorphochlora_amoeboformis.AAC.2